MSKFITFVFIVFLLSEDLLSKVDTWLLTFSGEINAAREWFIEYYILKTNIISSAPKTKSIHCNYHIGYF
jgi:hypothetical protein